MLRIRSSRCLSMDTFQETSPETGSNRLVEFYNSNGIYGGVTASVHDDELYIMGSCDTSHTLTFDLKISSRSGSVEDYILLEGVHEIYLKPCIQTCFAYTSIVKNGNEWVSVRRLRVLTKELTLTDDVERLTQSLDTEALAVVSILCLIFLKFHSTPANQFINSTL